MKTRKIPDMEAKRKATSDLNHENWDKEEEPEERGTFQVASEEEIKRRVIKKARRKISDDEAGKSTNVFSGFSGFAKTSSVATTASNISSPFSFLSKVTPTPASSSALGKIEFNQTGTDTKEPFAFEKSNTYYAKLKGLNQAVSSWIKAHVDKNPLCILTPIFSDYEKYLKEIEEEKPEGAASTAEFKFGSLPGTINDQITKPATATTSFSFGIKSFTSADKFVLSGDNSSSMLNKPAPTLDNKIDDGTKVSFDKPFDISSSKSTIASNNSSTFLSDSSTTISQGFSFSAAKPFTFGNVTKPVVETTVKEDGADDEDEPPKVEFKQVIEEDSVYSKKCKLFVKQDGNYAERGVGMIYLKPIKDKDKTQLIVRADTNLGNILLNIILNESIPAQRLGKNNVMMVCIPTPESDPKPTSVLLRVKTSDEADELLATINKFKK